MNNQLILSTIYQFQPQQSGGCLTAADFIEPTELQAIQRLVVQSPCNDRP
jgi:hypothetical protein